jgi:hypothetical protein
MPGARTSYIPSHGHGENHSHGHGEAHPASGHENSGDHK